MTTSFLFFACQPGTERLLKQDLAAVHPDWKLAFSRPGFLTVKIVETAQSPPTGKPAIPETPYVKSAFGRTLGWSSERLTDDTTAKLVPQVAARIMELDIRQLHVWQRDTRIPGDGGFEPFCTELASEIGRLVKSDLQSNYQYQVTVNEVAKSGTAVFDLVLVEPNQWWLGFHRVDRIAQQWPGGVPPQIERSEVISRAYYKLAESLLWSKLPLRSDDVCLELGSAPGGAVQHLVEQGARVIAVDPADLDESLQNHPSVTHLKMRSRDIRKRELRDVRWLFADLNVAPEYTLSAVEDIVSHSSTRIRGMIVTLKMTDWKLAGNLAEYIERVKSWGYPVVNIRQLAFGRQEICLAAFRTAYDQRSPKIKRPPRKKSSDKNLSKKKPQSNH